MYEMDVLVKKISHFVGVLKVLEFFLNCYTLLLFTFSFYSLIDQEFIEVM